MFRMVLIVGAILYTLNMERVNSFIEDCLGMSVDYTVKKWPDLSKKVLANSSKIVRDLREKARKKRGDVA